MTTTQIPTNLADAELIVQVARAATQERSATAHLVALLAELDARRLYLGEGCSSLFTYCTQVLHLSEHAAYGRIEAARASRRFPVILERLTDATIGLLAPHLTADNHEALLERARHKRKREVEQIVAQLRPLPAVPSTVRKLPTSSNPGRPTGPADLIDGEAVRPDCGARENSAQAYSAAAALSARPRHLVHRSSRRSRLSVIESSSRYRATRTTSSGAPRTCCAIRSRMAIPPRSSIVP